MHASQPTVQLMMFSRFLLLLLSLLEQLMASRITPFLAAGSKWLDSTDVDGLMPWYLFF